jgi:hypothetical protein
MLEDRLVLAATVLPQISLLEATTRDASSVTLDYSISKTNITHALTFDIYRSDSPVLDASSRLLGESTIDPSNDSQDLTQATHEVTLIPGTSLPPNQALPYIVVVADRNGAVAEDPASVNTTYFRTYLLGVVVHGMESTIANATPAWETSMASDLKTVDHYDNTIAFNWVKDSTMAAPGEATKAGDALYSQIVAAAGALDASHAGDVVDLHLIGHSRGAVVVSRALQDVASQHPRALAGSYTKVTLLDPHPANVADAGLYSAPGGLLGLITVGVYLSFESATKDPEVVLPANAGIKDIEVYYQHTPASGFSIFRVLSQPVGRRSDERLKQSKRCLGAMAQPDVGERPGGRADRTCGDSCLVSTSRCRCRQHAGGRVGRSQRSHLRSSGARDLAGRRARGCSAVRGTDIAGGHDDLASVDLVGGRVRFYKLGNRQFCESLS